MQRRDIINFVFGQDCWCFLLRHPQSFQCFWGKVSSFLGIVFRVDKLGPENLWSAWCADELLSVGVTVYL